MKSEKGVTLITLTIYILVTTVVVGIIVVVPGVIMKRLSDADFYNDPIAEYSAFNSYFSNQVNHSGIKILECNENYIAFDDGVQYTFVQENRGVYRNQEKICWDIDKCTFSETIENGKVIITVYFKAGGQERTTKYTLD